MQDTAFVVWQNISGSGMLAACYVCAVIFLFFYEKVTYKRILFVYLPACLIAVLLLPVTYRFVAEVIDEELYYRFFWMLPMTLVIAYTLVQLINLYRGKYPKLLLVLMVAFIVLCGDFVYDNWRYTKAENPYHVPDSVVQMCDLMHAEGREVLALFPMELMQYVRQYDSTICMPYGRDVLVEDWFVLHPLYDIMEAKVLDLDALGREAVEYGCVYVVIPKDEEKTGNITTAGYILKDTISDYQIYYNDEVFWSIYK